MWRNEPGMEDGPAVETLSDLRSTLERASTGALIDTLIILTHRIEDAKTRRPDNLPALRRQRDIARAEIMRRAS